jgi:hypothetical protein
MGSKIPNLLGQALQMVFLQADCAWTWIELVEVVAIETPVEQRQKRVQSLCV